MVRMTTGGRIAESAWRRGGPDPLDGLWLCRFRRSAARAPPPVVSDGGAEPARHQQQFRGAARPAYVHRS
ncbi:hypothetical protein [Streptomyces sp. NPDC004528]|uniref:hypothetical protein n=1 Tax=Streptomyces sp. NPDC004528 TaxID=3154550 RepID=UPI0033B1E717